MGYFRELPNIEYQSFLPNKLSSKDYITVKNLFRRAKIREDLEKNFTTFQKYQIVEGSRPELVAEELYGNQEFDWVVLISAGITNIRNQWPLSNKDLYEYAETKYGTEINQIRYYETTEVRNSKNQLILPAGKIVDQNFQISYYDEELGINVELNPVISISNYEYETKENDKKSLIYVLIPEYLNQFILDAKQALRYSNSSEYINQKLIRTENTRVVDS